MDVPVKACMSGDPVSIEADASALEALDCMMDRGIRHLPVLDAGRRVIGVLSIDDLRAALPLPVGLRSPLGPEERKLVADWRVGEIMTHAPVTVRSGTPLAEAAERMADKRIGCLPVVDAEGRLEGLLSETDVLHALASTMFTNRVRGRRGAKAELDGLVEDLARERAEITERLAGFREAERVLSPAADEAPRDQPERAAELRDLHLTETLEGFATRRLAAIDHALDQARRGRLDRCERCGGAIPLPRLRALPSTTLCIACARAEEGRG